MAEKLKIGDVLKEMREKTGFSKPSDYAREIDLAPSYVYQVEGNVQMPSKDYMDTLIIKYYDKSDEDEFERTKRIDMLVNMVKDEYVRKNMTKILNKADNKYKNPCKVPGKGDVHSN